MCYTFFLLVCLCPVLFPTPGQTPREHRKVRVLRRTLLQQGLICQGSPTQYVAEAGLEPKHWNLVCPTVPSCSHYFTISITEESQSWKIQPPTYCWTRDNVALPLSTIPPPFLFILKTTSRYVAQAGL